MTTKEQKKAVYRAIFEVMNISEERVRSSERTRTVVFARCVMSSILYEQGMSKAEIAEELSLKSAGLVTFYLKCCERERSVGFLELRKRIKVKYFEYAKKRT